MSHPLSLSPVSDVCCPYWQSHVCSTYSWDLHPSQWIKHDPWPQFLLKDLLSSITDSTLDVLFTPSWSIIPPPTPKWLFPVTCLGEETTKRPSHHPRYRLVNERDFLKEELRGVVRKIWKVHLLPKFSTYEDIEET